MLTPRIRVDVSAELPEIKIQKLTSGSRRDHSLRRDHSAPREMAACTVDIGGVFNDLWGTSSSDSAEDGIGGDRVGDAMMMASPRSATGLPRVECPCRDLLALSAFVSSPGAVFPMRYRSKKPAVLVGFASRWCVFGSGGTHGAGDAVHTVLAKCSSDDLVDVLHSNNARHFFANELCHAGRLPFHKVVLSDRTMHGEHDKPFYCRMRPIPNPMHALFNLNFNDEDPGILFKRQLCACWVGTRNSVTPLHFDTCHGFLAVLQGTKKVTLFPPEDTMYLYREQGTSLNPNSSKAD